MRDTISVPEMRYLPKEMHLQHHPEAKIKKSFFHQEMRIVEMWHLCKRSDERYGISTRDAVSP
jgi:hypothetical protein